RSIDWSQLELTCGHLGRAFQSVPLLFEKQRRGICRISSNYVGMLVDMLPAEGLYEVLLRREA
ncbi:TPA: hypothetical protein ACKRTL_006660, partial [Pseudomonas aeruginosa]